MDKQIKKINSSELLKDISNAFYKQGLLITKFNIGNNNNIFNLYIEGIENVVKNEPDLQEVKL